MIRIGGILRILILTTQVPFVRGGAEILAEQLQFALQKNGHIVETVAIPFKWYPPEKIVEHMLACRLLDVSESCGVSVDRVIGLKFPAYLIPHPNKVLWLLHQHRAAYDLWESPFCDLRNFPHGDEVRRTIHNADKELIPAAKGVYTISDNVSSRLKRYCGITSEPIYHPPQNAENFYCGPDEGYLFFPSRLNHLKRQELVLQALAKTRQSVKVFFAGAADNPAYGNDLIRLSEKLGIDGRVKWLGSVAEEEKRRHYAHCRGVIFPPLDEDYGYITLEAMLSCKPVITCHDSGGPLEFVVGGQTGVVAEPAPECLAEAMDELWSDQSRSIRWGKAGRERYHEMHINWENVVERLIS